MKVLFFGRLLFVKLCCVAVAFRQVSGTYLPSCCRSWRPPLASTVQLDQRPPAIATMLLLSAARSVRASTALVASSLARTPSFTTRLLIHPQQRTTIHTTTTALTMAKESMAGNPVAWWLFGCAGMLATTLTVGAAARLTRSGASMLYWVPTGAFPPHSDEDWQREFDVYNDFAHRRQRRPMSFEEFRQNFKYERLHRLLGQATTLAFLAPLGYFYVKEKLPTSIHGTLAGVLALGAVQMYVGQSMVQSHVKERHGCDPEKAPDFVAPHGLTYNSAFSMANMALLLWAGFHLVSPPSRAVHVRELTSSHALKDIGELRKYFQYATGLFVGAASAGTLVAGIDAGKEFNTFPKMNGQWIPDGIFDKKPWMRNFYDNVALVQLDHRLLAVATLGAYSFVYLKARKAYIWDNLPPETQKALHWTMLAVGGQAAGGITMLVNKVPTTLAMVHESGAAAILATSMWTIYTLRFARPANVFAAAKTISKAL